MPKSIPVEALPAEKKTVEEWATARGMLPAIHKGQDLRPQAPVAGQTVVRVSFADTGAFAPRYNAKHVHFAAAKALHQWPEGAELTEAEFDAAIAKASQITCR